MRKYSAWIWLGVALAALGLVAAFSIRQSTQVTALDASSPAPNGGLAVSLFLERLGYNVSVQSGQAIDWRSLPARATAMLLEDGVDLPSGASSDALRWVRAGGRIVLVTEGGTGSRLLGALGIPVDSSFGAAVSVDQPILLAPPVAQTNGDTFAYMPATPARVDVLGSSDGTVLTLRRMDLGDVWVLTAPRLIENNWIGKADNAKLLLNLAGPRGSAVVFDQFYPATAAAASSDWLTGSQWGVIVFFLMAIAILYLWLSGTRLGPPVVSLQDRHRPYSEYVTSMAALLRRGKARSEVLDEYRGGLRRFTAERRDLAPDSDLRAQALLSAPSKVSEQELVQRVKDIVGLEEEIGARRG